MPSFNLVIEVLLISRRGVLDSRGTVYPFQSRNRGSFDFKCRRSEALPYLP